MSKIRSFDNLVLDLRGNTGGLEDNLLRLTGYFFDHDVVLGETSAGLKPDLWLLGRVEALKESW